jgi:hypothetical protein
MSEAVIIQAEIANAIMAYGSSVLLSPTDFVKIVTRQESPLVVFAMHSGIFSTRYAYLTAYRGLAFCCKSKSKTELVFEDGTELVRAAKMHGLF